MSRRCSGGYSFCVLFALMAACATSHPLLVDFSEANKTYRNDDYPVALETWTRHGQLLLYDQYDIGTAMEIWATFKSWDFRQAYVAKYAKIYGLAESERDQLAKSQLETARAVYEIHMVAQSTTDRWNDLERRTSPWRITLLDGTGAELAPTSVKVEKLPEIYEYEFFPMRTLFSRSYTLRFVRPEGAGEAFLGPQSGRMILRVVSPVGKVEVAWEAKDSGPVP